MKSLEGGPFAELDAARTICASLGDLPLALVLAAALLARHPGISLAAYLARIRRARDAVANSPRLSYPPGRTGIGER